MTTTTTHDCDKEIRQSAWAMSGYRRSGDRWRCSCGKVFVHDCDEAEGCSWVFAPRLTRKALRR